MKSKGEQDPEIMKSDDEEDEYGGIDQFNYPDADFEDELGDLLDDNDF